MIPQDIVVCISSYSDDEKRSISQKITVLGGSYSENLTNQVTVLICGIAGTPKYSVIYLKEYRLLWMQRFLL